MKLIRTVDEIQDTLQYIASRPKKIRLGFTGVPPADIMREAIRLSDEIIDLDMPMPDIPISTGEQITPKICCATLRTIAANTLKVDDLDWIIFSSGIDKCDGGRFIAETIQKQHNIPVIMTENLNTIRAGNPICESSLPLLDKFQHIVDGIVYNEHPSLTPCEPEYGFWGVPPNDFSVLDLFPPTTHVFGWARCMENRTPADIELEELVNPSIPTVFFAQAFCPKNILAYKLAKTYNGLYVEVDSHVDRSTRAKIEAFLWLSRNSSASGN